MYTIGRLARKNNLSRGTLLYYDSIGLLSPTDRTESGYRLYSEADAARLEQICRYRRAGLSLEDIGRLLESHGHELARVLEKRLMELNEEIKGLRDQQRVIVQLLKNQELIERVGFMSRRTWVDLLAASGFSEADMDRWHVEFERHAPDKHQEFLEFLCIPEDEVRAIRQYSRQAAGK